MAGFRSGPVTVQDIRLANEALSLYDEGGYRVQYESSVEPVPTYAPRRVGDIHDIGINYNKWRKPVSDFGLEDMGLQEQISRHDLIKDFDVSHDDWTKSVHVINILMENILLKAFQNQANYYKGLSIKKYIKQGSSREGLKTRQADEFNTVLLFDIQGLRFEPINMKEQPGLGLLKVANHWGYPTMQSLTESYPELAKSGVFTEKDSHIYLNSRSLHERVFVSLIDSATTDVETKIVTAVTNGTPVKFRIKRQINPPSVNLTFSFASDAFGVDVRSSFVGMTSQIVGLVHESAHLRNQSKPASWYQIDVDVVPGLQISLDTAPNPFNPSETMKCPMYAVFKWRNESQRSARAFENPDVIWRFCTSGYEKHIMDVAQTKPSQRYILTACRILKAYMKSPSVKPTQFGHLMKSYFLKNITMYCILYVTVINGKQLSGVREAMGYVIEFLDISLQEERLPHYFYGNEWIKYMFPDYEPVDGYRVDLYESARKKGTLVNARQFQWRGIKEDLLRLCQGGDQLFSEFSEKFREFVRADGAEYSTSCP